MQNAYTTAPPPSYALESSSGESDWDDLASPARSELKPIKELARDATVETRGGENMTRAGRMVCLVGYTGERIVKEVMNPSREEQTTTAASVYVDGVQIASIESTSSSILVFLSTSMPLAALYPVTSTLIHQLAPSSLVILSAYHASSYITSTPPSLHKILYLRSTATPPLDALSANHIVEPFATPNLIHGLAASLFTSAAFASPPIPTTLFLVPTTSPQTALAPKLSAYAPSSEAEDNMFEDVVGDLRSLGEAFEWEWMQRRVSSSPRKGANAFEWLSKMRKVKRKEEVGAMYI